MTVPHPAPRVRAASDSEPHVDGRPARRPARGRRTAAPGSRRRSTARSDEVEKILDNAAVDRRQADHQHDGRNGQRQQADELHRTAQPRHPQPNPGHGRHQQHDHDHHGQHHEDQRVLQPVPQRRRSPTPASPGRSGSTRPRQIRRSRQRRVEKSSMDDQRDDEEHADRQHARPTGRSVCLRRRRRRSCGGAVSGRVPTSGGGRRLSGPGGPGHPSHRAVRRPSQA